MFQIGKCALHIYIYICIHIRIHIHILPVFNILALCAMYSEFQRLIIATVYICALSFLLCFKC